MAKMTRRMKELFEKLEVVTLGTSTPNGIPNTVPIGAKKIIDDETVLISDQFLNKTLVNIQSNPNVSVTYWEGTEGYQLKGTATIETSGQRYEDTARWIEAFGKQVGFPLKSKGAVILKIEEIYGVSPGPGAGRQLV